VWSTVVTSPSSPYLDPTILAVNTSYDYQVTATNTTAAGVAQTGPATLATFTTPALPGRPTLTRTGTTVPATLSWTFAAGATATSVKLERATANTPVGWATATILPVVGTTSPYIDPNVVPGTYYYRLTAINASGSSPVSTVLTVVVTLPTPVISRGGTGTQQAILNATYTGTGAGTATSFQLQRAATNNVAGWAAAIATTLTPAQLPYTDPTALPGTTYYYRIIAVTAVGNSPVSNALTVAVAALPAPSALTTAQSATGAATKFITVGWTSNSPNATGFIVERRIGTGAWTTVGSPVLLIAGQTVYSITDSGLVAGAYQYRVSAYYTSASGGATASSATATTARLTLR
jgi:hypothetical protein